VNRFPLKAVAKVLSRELATTVALLLGVSLVVFVILYMAPGDPFAALLGGRNISAEEREAAMEALGIPRTWYGQYLAWVGNVLQGDFGISMSNGQPVTRVLLSSGMKTLVLTLGSLVVTLGVAVPIAAYSAVRPASRIARSSTLLVYLVSALPTFWLGYMLIYFFTKQLGLFPIISATDENQELSWLYTLLPVVLLGLGNGALSEIVRYLREEISRVMSEEYVRTARAKGASIWKHAYKEALLLPVSQIIAAKMPFVLGGAIIVEQVFNWPGLGRVAWQAAQDRDYPVIMAITLLAAIVVRLGSFFHSTVYVAVNPRASHH
jgi:peptide/nickel transport system permease protein